MPSSDMSLPSSSTWAFDASVSAPVPAARSSTVLKPPYIIDTTVTTTAMKAATHAVERVSLRAGLPTLKTARERMMASASATPMTIKGTLIDSTIFHTSDQLMESIVDVLFQFRNPASQSQISSLAIPEFVSIDAGRRRPGADGNRHHLFNRTVGPARWGLVRSVGFAAQSVRVGKLAPACFATYVERLSPRQPRTLTEVGPAELNAGVPR